MRRRTLAVAIAVLAPLLAACDPTPAPPDPAWMAEAQYARAAYQVFGTPEPSAQQVNTWALRLMDDTPRVEFLEALARTQVSRRTLVSRVHSGLFDEPQSPGQLASMADSILTGATTESLAITLASSPEFLSASGNTMSGFVTNLTWRVLGRAPTPAELTSGTSSPQATTAHAVVASHEARGRRVDALYALVLQRSTTGSSVRNGRIAQLGSIGDTRVMIELVASDEFARLARKVPLPDTISQPTLPEPAPAELAVTAARSQLGVPYAYGASEPSIGFDCSGLVHWAYAQAGITMPRTSYQQIAVGSEVAMSDIAAGDLVFYNSSDHVGIYVGDGQIIHAARPGTVVRYAPIDVMPPQKVMRPY